MTIADSASLIEALSQVADVAWIENFVLHEKHNEYGAGVIMGANTANANGYDGSTQIVAVADTGLGGGTAATAHAGRARQPHRRPSTTGRPPPPARSRSLDDGAIDVDSGHGTHVALSVLGDGDAGGLGKGTAPGGAAWSSRPSRTMSTLAGSLQLFYGYTDGYYLTGIPANIADLYQQAYNAGARIHSNSWGTTRPATTRRQRPDRRTLSGTTATWPSPSRPATTAPMPTTNGVVDNDSIGSPATAKNVITVGASENDRPSNYPCDPSLAYTACASNGGQNSALYLWPAWPGDFPANPLNGDLTAGNAEQMAAFSSRGPTDDGRIKPDVVAPGTWILSGYSDLYQQGYDGATNPRNNACQYDGWGYPLNADYKYMGGTSMSNPLRRAAAAVVRDFYQKAYGHNASAALVKATLINSAVDLLDENNDGANDNDFPIPNVHEGWGRVNLAAATDGSAPVCGRERPAWAPAARH